MDVYVALLLAGVLSLGWCLTVRGGPGNWLMVAAAAVYQVIVPTDSRLAIGWPTVGVLAAFAVLGEVIEFVTRITGGGRVGASRRSAALAILGAGIGGLAGILIERPVSVIGSIAAGILLAAVGSFVGVLLGERLRGRSLRESWRIGRTAFWGHLWGTLAKTVIATVMVMLALSVIVV